MALNMFDMLSTSILQEYKNNLKLNMDSVFIYPICIYKFGFSFFPAFLLHSINISSLCYTPTPKTLHYSTALPLPLKQRVITPQHSHSHRNNTSSLHRCTPTPTITARHHSTAHPTSTPRRKHPML